MEKLIELLNEREKTVNGVQHPGWYKEHLEYQCHGPRVINKRFGFIKWLVDNGKIETNNLSLKAFKNIFSGGGFVEVSDLEVLLMLLSISDTPIEDLLLYLK